MKNINYILGNLVRKFGLRVTPEDKFPVCNLNLLALASLAFRGDEKINLVQVGAFDGDHADPVKEVIEFYGEKICAILLEPQPDVFKRLAARYSGKPSVIPVEAALADFDGEIVLQIPTAESLRTMATTREGFLRGRTAEIRRITVPAVSWGSLLNHHKMDKVHLLQIDAEGADCQLIEHILDSEQALQPLVIHFEVANLSGPERVRARKLLSKCGYSFCEGNIDALAVKDLSKLLAPQR